MAGTTISTDDSILYYGPHRIVVTSATPISTGDTHFYQPPAVSHFGTSDLISCENEFLKAELEEANRRISYSQQLSRKERRKRAAQLRKVKSK